MAKQYWIGDFYVDLSRNQISQQGQPQTLPPKALLVLTHLAENKGNVVSYDELLDKVWPNAVVTPNTLQRSIAQLRKVLGEDSKAQNIIKTHAKQGYSLECDVNWLESAQGALDIQHANNEPLHDEPQPILENAPSNNRPKDNTQRMSSHLLFKVSGVLLAAVLIALALFPNQKQVYQFGDLRYLTATDNKEHSAAYTPDGEHIMFLRYLNKICINNIWAKDAETLEEFQLTKEQGTYRGLSLSPDGETLIFVKEEDCDQPLTQTTCYKLMSIDFNAALREPQEAKELLRCLNTGIKKPLWIDNSNVAMLQKDQQNYRLIRYSIEDDTSAPLYDVEGGTVITFDFSQQFQEFIVTSKKSDGKQYIDTLSVDGTVLSSHPIQLPKDAPRHATVFPSFTPIAGEYVFTFSGKLYTLSTEGLVAPLTLPFEESVGGPYFHPKGNKILLIQGRYDSDILKMPIPGMVSQNDQRQQSIIERSIKMEDFAKFHPDGKTLALISAQTGSEQVWIRENDSTRLLSQFPKGAFTRNLIWSHSGDRMLVLANRELLYLKTNGDMTIIDFPNPVEQVFDWDSENHKALATIAINGIGKLVELDLDTLTYVSLNNKIVIWAAKSQSGEIVFMDHLYRIWRKGTIEDELIEGLEGQGYDQRFVISGEMMYGINRDNQLWSFDLASSEFLILKTIEEKIDYVTDIKGDELLLTMLVSEKKEVVELSVRN